MSQTNGNTLRAIHRALGGKSFGELAEILDQIDAMDSRTREAAAALGREQERLTQVAGEVLAAEAEKRRMLAAAQATRDRLVAEATAEARTIRADAVLDADRVKAEAERAAAEQRAAADQQAAAAAAEVVALADKRDALRTEVAGLEAKRAEIKAFLAKMAG